MMAQNPNKKIVIIGAGIAGLCTGVYARKSGLDAEIVEMNHSPGGLATSWRRDEYVFETCLHWLMGSSARSSLHSVWKEVFDIDQLKFFNADEYLRLETENGERLSIKRNVDALEKELLRISPEDRDEILHFTKAVRRLQNCELPLTSDGILSAAMSYLKFLPFLPELSYWSHLSCKQVGDRFKHPLIRKFFSGQEGSDMSALGLIFMLAWMSKGDAGYAIGGSQALIRPIEHEFKNLGGKIRFNSKVKNILASNGRARGVRLVDGTKIAADWVISAADGHSTFFDWIPTEYRDAKTEEPYQKLKLFTSYIQVSLGIKRDLSSEPGFLTLILDKPLTLDPSTFLNQVSFRIFNYDPTFAPRGKTAVTCFLPTRHQAYWTELREKAPETYSALKDRIAQDVIGILDRRIPGIRDGVEVIDISTPETIIRYTGNWKGSMEGFLPTPGMSLSPLPTTLPKLKKFMLVGQWAMQGGGLPIGLSTARRAVQIICREEGVSFLPSPRTVSPALQPAN